MQIVEREKLLGESEIPKLLLKFSIPAIVGMLVNGLYNFVDMVFIGNGVGPLGIAGVRMGFPIIVINMAFSMLIGIGANSLISIRLGQKRKEDAEVILGNALMGMIIIAALLTIAGLIFMNPLLKVFGASEDVMPYAQGYLSIILYGAIFQMIGMGMNNFIRGEGNPKVAMITMLIGAILNTILDPIFIFVFKWGIEGAALATILSMAVSAIWVLYYFLYGKSLLKIRKPNLKIRKDIIKSIITIGLAPFSMQLASSVLIIFMNKGLSHYGGDIAVSAMGIINNVAMIFMMVVFGINQGAQPIIGFNYGAQKYDRVKTTLKYAIGAATIVVTIGFISTRLFSAQIIGIFSNDPELIALGAKGLKRFLIFMPIIGFQVVSSAYFQAVGKPKQSMLLSLSRQVLILIPMVLILPKFMGLEGLFTAGPVADLFSSILTALFLVFELKHLDKQHENGRVNTDPRLGDI
ncbi:MATE family efflux transporter [Lutispora saccharofermentans]|mgnify:CR=1 FL=1|uniref:Multidrug export protein MepA n=1 Tax=Lutispora saccharofermentans TaxID=3024236 RepID=A0ABT1NF71_9FIRM|nr:MATE family efflux transporter [Lutispora saccharofermentans]MCQ1529920.1 MATE family efflux transporter [Lutispora saccharofermentans]